MCFNHLVLIGGGHSNVLLMRKWLMQPTLMPNCPISIISRDFNLVYSAMYPGVIAGEFNINECLIDINLLANSAKISFIKDEVTYINFLERKVLFNSRPYLNYSKLILNFGSQTKIPEQYIDLVRNKIAFPIKPFYSSYQIIKNEDKYNSPKELPFVIVGSGLAAIEMAFALRSRWKNRLLTLVCDVKKINKNIVSRLEEFEIKLTERIDFNHGKVLLCTGNQSPDWIKNNPLECDYRGRISTNLELQVNNFPDVFAVGDCAVTSNMKRPASGVFAVKAVNTLAYNLKKNIEGKKLKKWFPQNKGLQIVKTFNGSLETFSFFGSLTINSSSFFGKLKNNIDKSFVKKFKLREMKLDKKAISMENFDCRGCAAKIPQNILNSALRDSKLGRFADLPEDASEVIKVEGQVLFQSVDGFPALISDPWLNARITTLHACSDLWACGVRLSSINVLISLPKVEENFQNYLFTHSLSGIKSVVDELGGDVIGGHTYEKRSLSDNPFPLGIDISLTVNGVMEKGKKEWKKSGMKSGDVLLMSRPLGVGIFFAAQMRNINLFDSSYSIFKNLLNSQQYLIEDIHFIQNKIGKKIINASTDITGFGLLGHLKEMVDASNKNRIENNNKKIQAELDLSLFRAYPQILELINLGIRSSIFEENKKIHDQIISSNFEEQSIIFVQHKDKIKKEFSEIIELLLDPQTCGPLVISCNPIYEKYLTKNWYKIGKVL
tara:strand:+ start:1672 stop:3834 length:2163 start_codon:yes stop_codon:yes gene_type:complete